MMIIEAKHLCVSVHGHVEVASDSLTVEKYSKM